MRSILNIQSMNILGMNVSNKRIFINHKKTEQGRIVEKSIGQKGDFKDEGKCIWKDLQEEKIMGVGDDSADGGVTCYGAGRRCW